MQKVVFLDRDGVINKKAADHDYVKRWEEFVFLPGAIDALALLFRSGCALYVITNQRGISRGLMNESDLYDIHSKMQDALAKHGVSLSGIYHCPHGRDSCECRKPKPGLFFQAAREHDIDLMSAFFVGDSPSDVEAGTVAGCKVFLVDKENSFLDVAKMIVESA